MQQTQTLICPHWLIPIDSSASVLEKSAVLVERDTIIAVGQRAQLEAQYPQAHVIELPKHALLPGFVNAHTHSPMSLLRGYADDLPLNTWLNDHIWPAEAKWVNDQFVKDGSTLSIAEMLLGGTTCFSDMYFFPEVTAQVAQEVGIRAVVGLIVLDFPSVWAQSPDEYFERGLALNDELTSFSLVSAAFAPHSPYAVGDESLMRVQTLADELNLPIHIHLHETKHEVQESISQYDVSPIERLFNLGLLTPRTMAVHMTQITDQEREIISQAGIHVIHCPESNMKLASGACPTKDLAKSGINIALGTDGPASNNDLSMFGEMRSASLLAKVINHDAAALPAASILEMATLGGARALNLDDQIGSIQVGKQADLIAVDLLQPNTQPVYDPISTLVYNTQDSQVSDVWVAGKRVVKAGNLTSLSLDDIFESTSQWAAKIRG